MNTLKMARKMILMNSF